MERQGKAQQGREGVGGAQEATGASQGSSDGKLQAFRDDSSHQGGGGIRPLRKSLPHYFIDSGPKEHPSPTCRQVVGENLS